jgi:hypothetical protein
VVIEGPPAPPAPPSDVPRPPAIGVRDFDEINTAMSNITGIPKSRTAALFATLKQSLPVDANVLGFLASHQMSITQLGFAYCDALVNDNKAFFAPFNAWTDPPATAFAGSAKSDIATALYDKVLGAGLTAQPSFADIDAEVGGLLDDLTTSCAAPCTASRTPLVVKGACSAVLSSAGLMIQ